MTFTYSDTFYEEMKDANLASARVVVPHVMRLVSPTSVVDIGCGRGLWLKAFAEAGVSDIRGIDGEWVQKEDLSIPTERFTVCNLEKSLSFSYTADLSMSVEVAEHLPDASADAFVEALTKIAPVVLFSAAIPFQGGSHHINEQWPDYWEKKFRVRGYIPVDTIRRHVWNDSTVSFFYAQNILMYVKESELPRYPHLKKEIEEGHGLALSLVHPHMYRYYAERWRLVVPYLGRIPVPVLHGAKRLMQRLQRLARR